MGPVFSYKKGNHCLNMNLLIISKNVYPQCHSLYFGCSFYQLILLKNKSRTFSIPQAFHERCWYLMTVNILDSYMCRPIAFHKHMHAHVCIHTTHTHTQTHTHTNARTHTHTHTDKGRQRDRGSEPILLEPKRTEYYK